MSEEPATKKRRITGEIITINVGTEQVENLTVHESLLRDRPGFFKIALSQQWKEGRERKIDMPEDDPDTVATYIEWLYTKKISAHSTKPRKDWRSGDAMAEYRHLARIYVLGEKIQDDKLCNACMDGMTRVMDGSFRRVESEGNHRTHYCYPDSNTIRIIFNGTPEGSPARRFLVDTYRKYSFKAWFEDVGARKFYLDCPEFLLDLAYAFMGDLKVGHKEKDVVSDRRRQYYKDS